MLGEPEARDSQAYRLYGFVRSSSCSHHHFERRRGGFDSHLSDTNDDNNYADNDDEKNVDDKPAHIVLRESVFKDIAEGRLDPKSKLGKLLIKVIIANIKADRAIEAYERIQREELERLR